MSLARGGQLKGNLTGASSRFIGCTNEARNF